MLHTFSLSSHLYTFQPMEWMAVAEQFAAKWNFPRCLGDHDGKHIVIRPPPDSGSHYYSYKATHSIVLMALVDANYALIYVGVGTNGRVPDGCVWGNGTLRHTRILKNNTAGLSPDTHMPNNNIILPYVLIGDDAYPLKTYLMKPFPFLEQKNEQRIYYRMSRACHTVDNAFGIMAN